MTTEHQRGILAQYSEESGAAFYRTVMGDGAPVIHYGIYDGPSTSMRQATENATRRLLDLALRECGSFPPQNVIDLGSGPGGPAHFLAKAIPAMVTCVDLCPHHQRENESLAAALGISDRIRTWTGSFEQLPEDWVNKFDLAWSQEALCHASNKTTALREIRRVLHPGGLLVFSDILLSETAPAAEAEVFSKVNAVTRLATARDYLGDLAEAGFTKTEHIDWTPHLNENFRRMLAQIETHRDRLLAEGVSSSLLERFAASLEQRLSWRDGGVLAWGVFVAR